MLPPPLALLLGLLSHVAMAGPDDDPVLAEVRRSLLNEGTDAFFGTPPESRWRAAWQAGCAENGALAAAAPVDCARDPSRWWPTWAVSPSFGLLGGDLVPDNNGGDTEAGLVGARARLEAVAWAGPFTLRITPEVGGGFVPDTSLAAGARELWGGADVGSAWLGAGWQDRWVGPAHHGALVLSDNASAVPMVNGGLDGHLPGLLRKIGRFRAELGIGVLTAERTDVDDPGLLFMDLRWLPVPYFELGFNRLSIFGGEGRPAVDVLQLLIPSEPHVYDDPDRVLADQDELASLDFRLSLPLRKLWKLPVDHVAGWWEYGGEDMIMRDIAGVEYPALAGVGNLYGGEIEVDPVTVTIEYSQLMDDYFRWYVGHRVYHEGFTQADRVMGNLGGPDSEMVWGQVVLRGDGWRGRAEGEWLERVGVVEARSTQVLTFPTHEKRVRAGLSADLRFRGAWWSAGYSVASTTGRDFTAGNDAIEHRVVVGVSLDQWGSPGRTGGAEGR